MSAVIDRLTLAIGRPFLQASRGAADEHYRALAWLLNKPASTSAHYYHGTLRFAADNDELQELLEYLSDRTLGKLALVIALIPFFVWPKAFAFLGEGFSQFPQPFGFLLAFPLFVFGFLAMAGSVLRAATLRVEVSD